MKKTILTLLSTVFSLNAWSAPTQPTQKIGVSGRILNMANQPLAEADVELNIRVKVGSSCVGYEESHIVDLTNSKGYFAIKVGSGTASFGNSDNLWGVATLNCIDSTTYTTTNNDKRSVQVSFRRSGETTFSTFAEQNLSASAMAKNSERLNGKTSLDFIQATGSVDQGVMEDLASGNSALYAKPSDLNNLSSNQISGLGLLATKNTITDDEVSAISVSKINGLGALATKTVIDENDISGTIQNSKISGLGSLATKSQIDESDISGTIDSSKIANLGALALKNQVQDSDVISLDFSKLTGLPSSFTPSAHTHTILEVSNLQSSLDSKLDKAKLLLNCSADQTVSYQSITDSYSCQSIAINASAVSGLGSLATKSTIDENDISGTIQNSKISGLGSLATKNQIDENDISGTIDSSKISNLGDLASLNTIGDSKITDLSGAKLSGAVKISDSLISCSNTESGYVRFHLNELEVCDGTQWRLVSPSLSNSSITQALGFNPLNSANDLSDLSSISQAKLNLGLGSLADKSSLLESDIPSLTLSKISDAGSLASKSSVDDSDINSLSWNKLTNVPSLASAVHSHVIGDVSNLQSSLDNKADLSAVQTGLALKVDKSNLLSCSNTQVMIYSTITDSFSCVDISIAKSAVSGLQAELDSKANTADLGSLATKSNVADADIVSVSGSKITGGVQIGSVSGTTCSSSGLTRYNSGVLEVCDGSNWGPVSASITSGSVSSALGYVAMNPSNNLSDVSNVSTARTNLGLGSLATKSSLLDSDIPSLTLSKISDAGTLASKNSVVDADISGLAYSKLTGVPSTFPPSAHTHMISDITNLQSSIDSKISKSAIPSCLASQTLVYISVSDSFNCMNIAIDSSSVSGLGSLALKSSLLASDIPSLTLSKISDAGTLASKSSLLASDIPSLTLSKISDAGSFASKNSLSLSDITTGLGYTPQDKAKLLLNCTADQTVQYVSVSDSYSCQAIAITSSAVSGLGSLATKSTVADADITALSGSKLTGGVQIGAVSGTSCSSAGLTRYNSGALEFCNGSSWITLSNYSNSTIPILSNDQIENSINISATSSAPSKNSPTTDRVVYRRIGNRIQADFEFYQTSAGGAGSGTYLISLPAGLQFDTTLITPYPGDPNIGTFADLQRALVGYGHIASGSSRGQVSLFAYSATQIAVVAQVAYTNYQSFGSEYYALSSASIGFKFRVDAPISGWTASSNAYIDASAGVQAGTVITFAGSTCPSGYLSADGSAISRTTYSALFSVLGSSHGSGNGSTTFNLPDYRGRFLRGVDGSAGNDPDKLTRSAMNSGGNTGNNVGSVQSDSMQGHRHNMYGYNMAIVGGGIHPVAGFTSGGSFTAAQSTGTLDPISDGVNGTPRTSSETRPKNAYVNFCVKF